MEIWPVPAPTSRTRLGLRPLMRLTIRGLNTSLNVKSAPDSICSRRSCAELHHLCGIRQLLGLSNYVLRHCNYLRSGIIVKNCYLMIRVNASCDGKLFSTATVSIH